MNCNAKGIDSTNNERRKVQFNGPCGRIMTIRWQDASNEEKFLAMKTLFGMTGLSGVETEERDGEYVYVGVGADALHYE
jgi:hypothetical protein